MTQQPAFLAELKARIGHIGRPDAEKRKSIPFGVPEIDRALPDRGLTTGALHEVACSGFALEHGSAAALLVAGILARVHGPVLWVFERRDLFAPALIQAGLAAERLIFVEAGKTAAVLLAMEEGLRQRGVAGVVGEITGTVTLTASRRLQLAAEQSGAIGFAIRRGRKVADSTLAEPSAAATRWRVGSMPSPPALAHAPDTPGLGRAWWRLELARCRGGEGATWIVEACDEKGHLRLAADLADRSRPEAPRRRAVG